MSRLVPDGPRPVLHRAWRRGVPVGVAHLVANAVVQAALLPGIDRPGAAGVTGLERWLLGTALLGAATAMVWMAVCLRIHPGGNRWIEPPRHSGRIPVPDPADGCAPVLLALVGISLVTFVEVLAAGGGRDVWWMTPVVLGLQLAGVVATVGVVLTLVVPASYLGHAGARRGPAHGGGGPTGPLLVLSALASWTGAAIVAGVVGWQVGRGAGWWSAAATADEVGVLLAVLLPTLVVLVAVRVALGARARPA